MGNSFCLNVFGVGLREFVPSEDITGQDKTAQDILSKFMTKDQINQLWTIYCEIDVDQSGSIRDDEFRAFFSMEKEPFNMKLFSCFDADDSGYLNFFEFTCALWNFLSTDPYDLGGYIFYLFDDDKSGSLDFREIKKIIEIIHAQDLNKTGHMQDKINDELQNKPPYLDLDDFQKWTRAKPMLTNPVLNMQLKLQGHAAGQSFWKQVTKERSADSEKVRPGYVFGEIARAEAIYALLEKKKTASRNIDQMKGSVSKKAAASRPSDEKTLRRNSLMLGLMNLKEIKKPKRKNENATFNVEKFRDDNDMKFDEGPKKSRKGGDLSKKAVSLNAVMAEDDQVFVDSLDEQTGLTGNQSDSAKAKPSSPSKKKGRSTIAVVGKDTSPLKEKIAEKSEKCESGKTERSQRSTIISPKASDGSGKKERPHRSTVISPIGAKKARSTIVGATGSLPPIKAKGKTGESA